MVYVWPPMRFVLPVALLAACGNGGGDTPGSGDAGPDAPPARCEPRSAIGQLTRRQGNPRIVAGQTFTDAARDVALADPDVRFDAGAGRFELYYAADHAADFGVAGVPVIRRATSVDRMAWTVDDAPALAAAADPAAWDHVAVAAPSVAVDPDAPAARRYLMAYAGAAGAFPHAGFDVPAFAIGVAFSADGVTFARVPADEAGHGQDGLVLTGADVFPGGADAIVSDPELVVVDGVYHLWFSGLACGLDCTTVTDRGVSHATSTDGVHWTVAEAPVRSLLRASSDRASGGARPSVVYDDVHCVFELWLSRDDAGDTDAQPVALDNTAGMFKAESTDGAAWSVDYTRRRDLEWSATNPAAGEHLGIRAGADVTIQTGGRVMVYVGFDDASVPEGATLPSRGGGDQPGVMGLDLATRDLP